MPAWMAIALLLVALARIGWGIGRERRIFMLRVESGRVVSARGRISAGLLGDVRDVVAGSTSSGTIVALRAAERARVVLRGSFSPEVGQRLRNVVGALPLAKILNAPRRR